MSSSVGLIALGRPIQSPDLQISPDTVGFSLNAAHLVREIVFFITAPLPDGFALSVYAKVAEQVMFIGSLDNSQPSKLLRLVWPAELKGASFDAQVFGRVEAAGEARQKVAMAPCHSDEYQIFAKYIAQDLFRYLESFSKYAEQFKECLIVPTNILDRWFDRFMSKFKHDPFFWFPRNLEDYS